MVMLEARNSRVVRYFESTPASADREVHVLAPTRMATTDELIAGCTCARQASKARWSFSAGRGAVVVGAAAVSGVRDGVGAVTIDVVVAAVAFGLAIVVAAAAFGVAVVAAAIVVVGTALRAGAVALALGFVVGTDAAVLARTSTGAPDASRNTGEGGVATTGGADHGGSNDSGTSSSGRNASRAGFLGGAAVVAKAESLNAARDEGTGMSGTSVVEFMVRTAAADTQEPGAKVPAANTVRIAAIPRARVRADRSVR